jgi:hypothetical protein
MFAIELDRSRRTGILCSLAFLLLSSPAASAAARGQDQTQRIPRQTGATTASIQGIVRTPPDLGLGDVIVLLQDLSNGKSTPTKTAGDGSFRFLNIKPGRYQIRASREGFDPYAQGDIQLAPGQVFTIEFMLKPVLTGNEGVRDVPRRPELGPRPPSLPPEPSTAGAAA